MGIGRSKLIVAGALLAVMSFAAQPAQAVDHNSGIWRVLRAGHFSDHTGRRASVLPIKGEIVANGRHYKFWEYEYVSLHSTGSHSALLVFEKGAKGLSYLGYYRMDPWEDFKGPVHPVIRGKSVYFPFHTYEILGIKQGFSISFEKGPPLKPWPDSYIEFQR